MLKPVVRKQAARRCSCRFGRAAMTVGLALRANPRAPFERTPVSYHQTSTRKRLNRRGACRLLTRPRNWHKRSLWPAIPPPFPQSSTTYFHYPQLSHRTHANLSCAPRAHPAKCLQTKRGNVLKPLDKRRAAVEIRSPFEGDCGRRRARSAFRCGACKRHLHGVLSQERTDSGAADGQDQTCNRSW